jgi:hypothetical protein
MNNVAFWALLPVSIAMLFVLIGGLISVVRGKVIIDEKKVIEVGIFKSKEIEISQIKGFRSNEYYTHLIPIDDDLPKIKISQYYGDMNSFQQWLLRNYSDLDALERKQEEEDILKNEEFGLTIEEREGKLKSAKIAAGVINAAGIILAILLFFYPRPYQIVTLCAIIFPIIVIGSLYVFKGLIRVDQKPNSGYPTILYALVFPGMAFAARSSMDFDILEYSNFWLPAMFATVISLFIMLSSTTELNFKKGADYATAISLFGFLFVYSYGGVINYNCIYDKSKTEIFTSEIKDMRISTGESTSYYIDLQPWGPLKEADDVSISKRLYEQLTVGGTVNIHLNKGKMDIPWFTVTEK